MTNLFKEAAASLKDAVATKGTELMDSQRDKLTKDLEAVAQRVSRALIICGGLIAFGFVFHAVTLILTK